MRESHKRTVGPSTQVKRLGWATNHSLHQAPLRTFTQIIFFARFPLIRTGVTFFHLAWLGTKFIPPPGKPSSVSAASATDTPTLPRPETSYHPPTLASTFHPDHPEDILPSFHPSIDHPPACEPLRSTTTGLKFHSVCLLSLVHLNYLFTIQNST